MVSLGTVNPDKPYMPLVVKHDSIAVNDARYLHGEFFKVAFLGDVFDEDAGEIQAN
jgi:hypothetical protein